MPSQQQLRWSQLRVGITVLVAAITLAVLIFLMNEQMGLFSSKIRLKAYFDNASGLREGAPVRLEGVDIGNVTSVRVIPNHPCLPQTVAGVVCPVEVTLKVSTRYGADLRKDSQATLSTAGVLGETFVDITSRGAKGPEAKDNDTLQTLDRPDLQDMMKAGQGTLQNMQTLLTRLDSIVSEVQNGNGSVHKFIYDPGLYNRANQTLDSMQKIVNDVNNGHGTVGKLLKDEEMYNKINQDVDKLSKIIADIDAGKGNAGKLLKDETLYKNLNDTVAKANQLMDDINKGQGALGLLAKDPEFAKKLNTTISNLSQISDKLNNGTGTAGKLINDPSLYTNADQMLVETRNLVKAIRENPKKYLTIHFKVF